MTISTEVIARLRDRGLEHKAAEICLAHGVTLSDACGVGKPQSVALARKMLYSWLSTEYRYSSVEIGRLFNRDRSAISRTLRK